MQHVEPLPSISTPADVEKQCVRAEILWRYGRATGSRLRHLKPPHADHPYLCHRWIRPGLGLHSAGSPRSVRLRSWRSPETGDLDEHRRDGDLGERAAPRTGWRERRLWLPACRVMMALD